jgi:hypothetical protein
MRVEGEFSVASYAPAELSVKPLDITTGVSVGIAVMEKQFTGAIDGRSATLFTSAFDPGTGVGSYVAMESFEGTVGGGRGTFNFLHSATTHGSDRAEESFVIVPSSGTGELSGISGAGGMTIDPDGTHRIWLDLTD